MHGKRNPLDALAVYGERRCYQSVVPELQLFVSVYDDRRDDENRFLRFVGNTRLINVDQTHGFRSPYRSRIWSARR